MADLRQPKEMCFTASNTAEAWHKFERAYRIYHTAAELNRKTDNIQIANFLNTAGPEAQEIFDNFVFSEEDGDKKTVYEDVLKKFKAYCEPRKNEIFETHRFQKRVQLEGETFDAWLNDLRTIAAGCNFETIREKERNLRNQVVFGIFDTAIQERLLQMPNLTLGKAIDICHAAESSKDQIKAMNNNQPVFANARRSYAVDVIKRNQRPHSKATTSQVYSRRNCKYCGNNHPPKQCPAYGKTCNKCGYRNHFATVCRRVARKVNDIETQEDVGFLKISMINDCVSINETKMKTHLNVVDGEGHKFSVLFKLDTGAEANVIPLKLFNAMSGQTLTKTTIKLCGFGNSTVRPLGTTVIKCFDKNNECVDLLCYVTDVINLSILGEASCSKLNLVKRVDVCIEPLSLINIRSEYGNVFTGNGSYEKHYHIQLQQNAKPVIQHPRRIPYAVQPKLKSVLDTLEDKGIVAPVDTPTEWVSNLVVVEKKNKDLRICLDPKPLNAAIMRERHNIPTPGDVQAKLSGKSIFTVIDMKDGYWHVKLSDESSYLTTFHTPWGRKRFLRMPFGISSASEVMQKRNEETFGDINGVHVIADDIIVAASSEKEHDQILRLVLERANQKGVRFNEDKIQFKVRTVSYMGNLVTENGLKPDDNKIKAIVNMPKPSDIHSLQRLLGMTKYLAQYIPNESTITAPLRQLLKKDAEWKWDQQHDDALNKVKSVLTSKPVLSFYDVSKPITIQSDASQSGLGACLLQEGKAIAYASRSMTPAEVNYAQIEKEMLSIVFATKKFHQYIYGKESISVESDHKPIESIMKKPLCKAPPRLQRLMLLLQPYDLRIKYVPGKLMYMADTLSRAYLEEETDDTLNDELVRVIHSLITSLPVTTSKLAEIQHFTKEDPVLQKVKGYCKAGWPRAQREVPIEVRKYWNIRDDLYEAEGIILMEDRIIIPSALRPQMLKLIHESHLGMEKCKSRARELLYWPRMSADIEEIVSNCDTCNRYQRKHQKEPLISHEIPDGRFLKIGMDIMTFKAVDYLVVVDYYSKYPEVLPLVDKTAKTIVEQLKSVIARHGVPETIISDNMPFRSKEFVNFANAYGITTSTSSPEYPQSNGQAERTVQTVKNLMKKSFDDGNDQHLALLEYRNTPISGLMYSPAQILMSRRLRTKLPCAKVLLEPKVVDVYCDLRKRQKRQKYYYDRNTKSLPNLEKGDKVRYKSHNNWNTAIVTGKHDQPRSYIVRNKHGHNIRRNRRQLYKAQNAPGIFVDDYIGIEHDSLSHNGSVTETTPAVTSNVTTVPLTTRYGRRIVAPTRYPN